MSKALRRLKEQMEIDFLKSKTYTEINEMFNQMKQKVDEAESELNKLNIGVVRLSFDELKDKVLKHKAKSEYKQASIVILRNIFEEYEA